LQKKLIFGFKKAKKLEVFKSINSSECSPLSNATFYGSKAAQKAKVNFFFFFSQTFGNKSLSFPYVWTSRLEKVLSPSGVFFYFFKQYVKV